MEAWDHFLKQQEAELGSATVLKWLHSLKIIRFDACNLYLEAKDSFQVSWFEEHIRPKVLQLLFNNNKKSIKVHLAIAKKDLSKEQDSTNNKESPSRIERELNFDTIDPHYSFDLFVEPKSTPLPSKLLSALNDKKAPTFNPIYLYGNSGRGKTHLLQAAASHLQNQGFKVIYVHADTFTEHVVAAIRAGEMSAFRQAYRSADVLIIDDIQVFARKAATQEEFFHTFNTLHVAGKQIILAADSAPQALLNIEPRLISRFEWGIVLPLGDLSSEELTHMLDKKAQSLRSPLSPKIIQFLIETFPSGTKALTKALHALILRTHLDDNNHHRPIPSISIAQAKALLSDLIADEQKMRLTPQKIIQQVSEFFGILPEDLTGKAQSRDRVLPRQIAMYFCRKELKLPFVKVGEIFSKDHSTVMSSVKIIETAIQEGQRDIIDPLEAIRKRLH
ncbi:MAG: chromosomal replication initiator protein DnaA [Parachlamydiaceae bacterium]